MDALLASTLVATIFLGAGAAVGGLGCFWRTCIERGIGTTRGQPSYEQLTASGPDREELLFRVLPLALLNLVLGLLLVVAFVLRAPASPGPLLWQGFACAGLSCVAGGVYFLVLAAQRQEIARLFGSQHRGLIGLLESTDADVMRRSGRALVAGAALILVGQALAPDLNPTGHLSGGAPFHRAATVLVLWVGLFSILVGHHQARIFAAAHIATAGVERAIYRAGLWFGVPFVAIVLAQAIACYWSLSAPAPDWPLLGAMHAVSWIMMLVACLMAVVQHRLHNRRVYLLGRGRAVLALRKRLHEIGVPELIRSRIVGHVERDYDIEHLAITMSTLDEDQGREFAAELFRTIDESKFLRAHRAGELETPPWSQGARPVQEAIDFLERHPTRRRS